MGYAEELKKRAEEVREKTYQEMGREMVDAIRDICNGKMTKAEAFGFSDIAVDHVCRFV